MFVDEMGTHTSLAPLYAYGPIGERAFFELPRNRGTNTTLLSSLHLKGMGPSMAVEGATTKEVFEAYVKHFLVPALQPGQLVVMDNLGAHRPKRVRELIEGKGCELLVYLPPYSSDLNPIEEAFSKVKHLLRKIGARSKEALIGAMGQAFVGSREQRRREGVLCTLWLSCTGAITMKVAVRCASRSHHTVCTVCERCVSMLRARVADGILRLGERLVEPARPDKLRSFGRGEE